MREISCTVPDAVNHAANASAHAFTADEFGGDIIGRNDRCFTCGAYPDVAEGNRRISIDIIIDRKGDMRKAAGKGFLSRTPGLPPLASVSTTKVGRQRASAGS